MGSPRGAIFSTFTSSPTRTPMSMSLLLSGPMAPIFVIFPFSPGFSFARFIPQVLLTMIFIAMPRPMALRDFARAHAYVFHAVLAIPGHNPRGAASALYFNYFGALVSAEQPKRHHVFSSYNLHVTPARTVISVSVLFSPPFTPKSRSIFSP